MPRRLLPLLAFAALLAGPAAARAAAPGINISNIPATQAIEDRAFGEAADLHAGWIRMFMAWDVMEPAAGSYDPNQLAAWDRVIARAKASGLKVDIVFDRAPAWAAPGGDPDPAQFAEFARAIASRYAGQVSAYEVWNEEDEGQFWPGGAGGAAAPGYTQLLKAAYPAIKVADPSATVLVGGLVGNDYKFLEAIYADGGQGSFDGVAVHTDTACNIASPDAYFRDADTGRVSRYSFTGYREVRQTMLDHGEDKPVWMTELGWSSTSTVCDSGMWAGKKAGGVSEADQAKYLTEAYRCLAQDAYVPVAMWFNMEDFGAADTSMNRFGLVRSDLSRKPAFAAFQGVTGAGAAGGSCGGHPDTTAPTLSVVRPTAGAIFTADLPIEAKASDDQQLKRIELLVDGVHVRNFQGGTASIDYQGAKKLPLGDHTVTLKASDMANHVTTVDVPVKKVDVTTLGPFRTTTSGSVRLRRHSHHIVVSGRVVSPGVAIRILGKAHVDLARRSHGHWKTTYKYMKNADKSFRVSKTLKPSRARWRLRIYYVGAKPFRSSHMRTLVFSLPARHGGTLPKRHHAKTHAAEKKR